MRAFIGRFLLVPIIVCAALGYGALMLEGWTEALAVGILTGVAITAWALSSILAWKIERDREEHDKLRRAVMHELGYTHGEETVRRLRAAL